MAEKLNLTIDEDACRGCGMCAADCPTQAIRFDEAKRKAVVGEVNDCISCLSCVYVCPSGAVLLSGCHAVPNFYRNIKFSRRMEKYL